MFWLNRRKKWNERRETNGTITAYLYCPSCQNEGVAYKKEFEKAKSCEECHAKGIVLLRPHAICYECKYAFPIIDYKMDKNSITSCVCPNCGHAEHNFRNKAIYLRDSHKPLKPKYWQNEVIKYPCSLNSRFIKKKKKVNKKRT